ncbi:hypothetical protein BpHYR1_018498 [Brachionus plicatilis]|uniref:Uncharacterized protein n=1 Tax=Brachionus plicatilis TaxID=10195 RepID=A0A3M7Q9Z0_BRAPC|nr:hypothetical protein BpHYR1_018498 [Brachionus plicatilis]
MKFFLLIQILKERGIKKAICSHFCLYLEKNLIPSYSFLMNKYLIATSRFITNFSRIIGKDSS